MRRWRHFPHFALQYWKKVQGTKTVGRSLSSNGSRPKYGSWHWKRFVEFFWCVECQIFVFGCIRTQHSRRTILLTVRQFNDKHTYDCWNCQSCRRNTLIYLLNCNIEVVYRCPTKRFSIPMTINPIRQRLQGSKNLCLTYLSYFNIDTADSEISADDLGTVTNKNYFYKNNIVSTSTLDLRFAIVDWKEATYLMNTVMVRQIYVWRMHSTSQKRSYYDYDQKSYLISIESWTKCSSSEVIRLPHKTNNFNKKRLTNTYLTSGQFDKWRKVAYSRGSGGESKADGPYQSILPTIGVKTVSFVYSIHVIHVLWITKKF